ncbi:MAG: S-methyl-5'-thioinosine phosphorylase [Pseudomonadales bacterium]
MSWAVIGGSAALPAVAGFEAFDVAEGAFGPPSAAPRRGRIGATEVVFLARHGEPHRIAPHAINSRANVDLLARLGVSGVIALTTVGGITARAPAGALLLPHQLIDYTWGRPHTFSDAATLLHADFAEPFDAGLRRALAAAAQRAGVELGQQAVYGCTQGPRFETAAEIERMDRDGCDIVGMTAMPEAALARERGLPYALVSLVVNPAAGRAADPFDMDAIRRVSATGMAAVDALLRALFAGG